MTVGLYFTFYKLVINIYIFVKHTLYFNIFIPDFLLVWLPAVVEFVNRWSRNYAKTFQSRQSLEESRFLCFLREWKQQVQEGTESMSGVSRTSKLFCTCWWLKHYEEGFFSRWTMAKESTMLLIAICIYEWIQKEAPCRIWALRPALPHQLVCTGTCRKGSACSEASLRSSVCETTCQIWP